MNRFTYREGSLTAGRRQILEALIYYKFLSTRQIWQEVQSHKLPEHTRRDLARLRELGFLTSFNYEPEKGTHGQLCWRLTARGARIMGQTYNGSYSRIPTRQRIEYRDLELQLLRTVREAGWQLLKPDVYNGYYPRPPRTPQYELLARTVDGLEHEYLKQARQNGTISRIREAEILEGSHLACVPKHANDYVAYQTSSSQARVLILYPPQAGRKFWRDRLARYSRLAERVPVAIICNDTGQLLNLPDACRSPLTVITMADLDEWLQGSSG